MSGVPRRRTERTGAFGESPVAVEHTTVGDPATLTTAQTYDWVAGVVLLLGCGLYIWTCAPTVTLVDSGELIVAARTLGVAHPPGFPLYVLLAHLATLIPVGDIARRVNLASAVFGALAAAALSIASIELLRGGTWRAAPVSNRSRRTLSAHEARLGWVAPLVSASLLLCSDTLWSYATVAEVYTLNTLIVTGLFILILRWRRQVNGHNGSGAAGSDRLLFAAALLFGLGLGVHHVTVALTLPAIALLVYATRPRIFVSSSIVFATVCAFAGLAIYLYLPLAATYARVLDWGDPRTPQRFWWHITGRQFQAYFSLSPDSIGAQLGAFGNIALRQFGPAWLPAGLGLCMVGLYDLWRRDRSLLWFLVLLIVADVAYAASYEIAEDKAAYYLPAFVAACLAAGCGAHMALRSAGTLGRASASYVAAAALLLVPLLALGANWRSNDRHRDFIARDYVNNILNSIQPGGLLLTLDWQVYSPMLYIRTLEHRRLDATVIDVNLLRRSWYSQQLEREYPQLMHDVHAEATDFLEDLLHWEQDPGLYQRDRVLNERIDTRFTAMILAIIAAQLRSGPVYVTQDLVLSRDVQNNRLTKALSGKYPLVPQGLVFQLFQDRVYHDPPPVQLDTTSLIEVGLRFQPDDVVRLKVFPVYVTMLYNRGRYLALGRRREARGAFEQALALDPAFGPAQRALAELPPEPGD